MLTMLLVVPVRSMELQDVVDAVTGVKGGGLTT